MLSIWFGPPSEKSSAKVIDLSLVDLNDPQILSKRLASRKWVRNSILMISLKSQAEYGLEIAYLWFL